jgi:hypothetical protein
MSPPSNAATITVSQTLNLLDGPFRAFAAGFAEDRYALWLGSGISFGRVQGLKQIVPRVLEYLRSRIVEPDPKCRFKLALQEALKLASLSTEEKSRVDLNRPFQDWADFEAITLRLGGKYAHLLDIQVEGEPDDFLLWAAVDTSSTFADPAIEPDVEHLCVAILILEGVSSEIASANWDGLIEKAVASLTQGREALVVCVQPQDIRQPRQRSRLLKFHGCAVKAAADEATYRPFLVGRQSQINGWVARQELAALVDQLTSLVVTKPTLMMGLSAQDANIQAIFAKAEAQMPWPWPGDRPSYVFSEDEVGFDQKALLKNVYRVAFTPGTHTQILESALIRAYGKPLLIALVLCVLTSKLGTLINLAPGGLNAVERQALIDGVTTVRNVLATSADGDRLSFVQTLVDQSSRAIGLFRDGHATAGPRSYNPITKDAIQHLAGNTDLPASGLCEAAVAAGILGLGAQDGTWTIESIDPADLSSGIARIQATARSAKLFFASNSDAFLRLQHNGHLVPADDVIVIHSSPVAPAVTRSPRGKLGRTGHVGMLQVDMSQLLADAVSIDDLRRRFRVEAVL